VVRRSLWPRPTAIIATGDRVARAPLSHELDLV
jgi:hypothetical protein